MVCAVGALPFQSTLPRGERLAIRLLPPWYLIFQSTLPRGERRNRYRCGFALPIISIHAPAWGATITPPPYLPNCQHFNPRSRVGSDALTLRPKHTATYFNPRSRVGSDRDRGISDNRGYYFNPRSRVGSDGKTSGHAQPLLSYFNPRSRVGSDDSLPCPWS